MLFRNLGAAVGFYRAVNATAAGTTEIDGASFDLRTSFGAPYEGITFICALGTLTATQTTTLKIQGSADASTWVDIANTHQGPANDSDSNKLLVVDIYRPGFRYVRPVVTRGTANAVIDAVVGIPYLAHSQPVSTQDATVSVPTSSGSYASPVPVNIVAYGSAGTA